MKISVDAVAGGAPMGKSIEAAKALLEEMASNNYHWASESVTPKRGGGKHAVDTVTLLASRVDALAQRLEKVATHQPLLRGRPWGPMPFVRHVVYRATLPLSVTMLPPALNTSAPTILTPHHLKITPIPPPIARVGRVTQTPSTKIPPPIPRAPCNHQAFTTELPTLHPLHLLNLHLTWRVLWSAS